MSNIQSALQILKKTGRFHVNKKPIRSTPVEISQREKKEPRKTKMDADGRFDYVGFMAALIYLDCRRK